MTPARPLRLAAALLSFGVLASSAPAAAAQPDSQAATGPGTTTTEESRATEPVYFVHGYNSGAKVDCDATWKDALGYFAKHGRSRQSLKTVGYYEHDSRNCDVDVGNATVDTPIRDIAANLANEIHRNHTSKGRPVKIVAHSMGGLITRVALLGSAQGWAGFPKEALKVSDVVTLATPHRGVSDPGKHHDAQWRSMRPDSHFMDVLHAPANGLDRKWAASTDWSFAGSDEDGTVNAGSATDRGAFADHKYRYRRDADHDISHSNMRELVPGGGKYNLRYQHAKEHGHHDTRNGWAPVETAFNAVDRDRRW